MKIQSRCAYDPASDLLGSGGFARVFRARDELLHRDVALKVFNVTGSQGYTVLNFDVLLLEQSNALGEKEQLQIGVMEYANAGDLKQFARANPGSAQLEVLLAEVLHGLAYLHGKGIVHRDLKAQNILPVRQGGRLTAKLADFGVSKELGQAGQSSSVMVGTIEYMAPEQFSPQLYGIDGKIGPSLDLWSFGVMVHELLTGRTPFGGRDGATTTEQIMRGHPVLRTPRERRATAAALPRRDPALLGDGCQGPHPERERVAALLRQRTRACSGGGPDGRRPR